MKGVIGDKGGSKGVSHIPSKNGKVRHRGGRRVYIARRVTFPGGGVRIKSRGAGPGRGVVRGPGGAVKGGAW